MDVNYLEIEMHSSVIKLYLTEDDYQQMRN